ncbi:hypothetical protein [Paraburkholderia humisilvae]|nr:hypothetical protein [Paraburkholderia humisilvae]
MNTIPEFGANPDYPYYRKGVTQLPPHINPPLDEYTNMAMCGVVGEAAGKYLQEHKIDDALARETVYGIVVAVNRVFEKDLTEWVITNFVDRKKFPDETDRLARIDFRIQDLEEKVGKAVIETVQDSPLMSEGKPFRIQLAVTAATALGKHLAGLKTYPDRKE